MDFFKMKPPVDIFVNFGSDLLEFYHQVICKEFDVSKKCNVPKLKRAVQQTSRTASQCESDPVFNTATNRCAYMFKHSPLISSIAAHHLFQLFKHDPYKIEQPLHQGELKVCCLGGGPGTDAVAVSKIVTAVHQAFWFHNRQQLKLQITIIDNDENWKITAQNVMEMLEQTSQFFDADKMSLSFQFLEADLTQPLKGNALLEICKADILTMFYFVSSLQKKTRKPAVCQMIQRIFDNMKTGALLFFIDVPVSPYYRNMSVSASMFQNLNQIYGPHEHKLHFLSLDAIVKNIELYSEDLGFTMCSYSCISTVSAWCKETRPISNLTSLMEKINHIQKIGSEIIQEKNRSERNANQKKISKREKNAIRMRIIEERRIAKQRSMLEREKNASLNAALLKAFNYKVHKLLLYHIGFNTEVREVEEQDYYEDGAFFLTKPKSKRIFYEQKLQEKSPKLKGKNSKKFIY